MLAASQTTKPVSDTVKTTDENVEESELVKSDIESIEQNTIFTKQIHFRFQLTVS